MDEMTVGEVVGKVGISSKTVRLWEARGLIPEAERSSTGYRLFSEPDIARLQFICQAKSLGLTLAEIGEILSLRHAGQTPCERVSQLIDARIVQIDQAIDDLHRLRETLADARNVTNDDPRDGTGLLGCHIIERSQPVER